MHKLVGWFFAAFFAVFFVYSVIKISVDVYGPSEVRYAKLRNAVCDADFDARMRTLRPYRGEIVHIVSMWTPELDSFARYTSAINAHYAAKWRERATYAKYPLPTDAPTGVHPSWTKLWVVRDCLQRDTVADGEWVAWIDADAAFSRHEYPPDVIVRAVPEDIEMIASIHDFYPEEYRWDKVNMGVFFLKKTARVLAFLEAWMALAVHDDPNSLHEQDAFEAYYLEKNPVLPPFYALDHCYLAGYVPYRVPRDTPFFVSHAYGTPNQRRVEFFAQLAADTI